jgi:Mn2+/Fe2+ NRAMP family transporter
MLVAIIGTSLSAYLYTWQSNVEVEEEIEQRRARLSERRGATRYELRQSRNDILTGMLFSNVIIYFIILSTGAALYRAGQTDIETAANFAGPLRRRRRGRHAVRACNHLWWDSRPCRSADYPCQVLGWKSSL